MKEQVSAATLGSYIRGVVIPLVELPCRCSFYKGDRPKCQELHLGHGGEDVED